MKTNYLILFGTMHLSSTISYSFGNYPNIYGTMSIIYLICFIIIFEWGDKILKNNK